MAEYIEREVLLQKNMYGNSHPIEYRTYAEKLIKNAPTADVVPREEVKTLVWLNQSLSSRVERLKKYDEERDIALHAKLIANTEDEIARKIFAELETVLYGISTPTIRADGTVGVKHVEGLHIRTEDYATIKKKYTEGKK